jgi:DNA-binding NarL/FixJ family response regulator
MSPIRVMFASPDKDFRTGLRGILSESARFELLADAGRLERLALMAADGRPDILVLEAAWLNAMPSLLAGFSVDCPNCRVVLVADSVAAPEMLAAVQRGVRGCGIKTSNSTEWQRTLIAVHEGEIWVPRWLLAEALSNLQNVLPTAAARLERLTERQREIMGWVASGLSNKEIAGRLGISPATVKTHLHNIFERIGISGRQRIVAQAHRDGSGADGGDGVSRD